MFFTLFCLALSLLLGACGRSVTPYTKTGFAFDTVISFTYYDKKDEAAIVQASERLFYYENVFSRTREGSELYELNRRLAEAAAEGIAPVRIPVSAELYQALKLSLEYAEKTNGAFDPTLGKLLELYNFSGTEHSVPSEEVRAELLSHCGPEKLHLAPYGGIAVTDSPAGTAYPYQLTVDDPQIVIDLGGMAKGYIADRLKEQLKNDGVESAIINLGGNILLIGEKPDGSAFTVGVQEPKAGSSEYLTTFPLTDASAVTSGSYQRYFEQGGVTYHHILDPKTGLPAESGLVSVTVVAGESAAADILSTSLFVMGEESGRAFLENFPDITAYFVDPLNTITKISH